MRLGATLVHLADAPPFSIVPWARRLQAAGFDSLWAPHVVGRGSLVPDPFVALAAAAAVTTGLELGTATVQLPLHHPADLAHRVHSLLCVAGDRLTLGISPGSTRADYAALGRDHSARFEVFRSSTDRLRVLLRDGRDDDVAITADVVTAPQLLLGSWGANVERAAQEFDGWLASGFRRSPDQVLEAHERYRAAGGRRAIVCAVPVNSEADLDPTGAALRRYSDAGFDDAVVLIGPDGPDPAAVRALLPRAPAPHPSTDDSSRAPGERG